LTLGSVGFYCNPSTCGQYQGGKYAPILLAIILGWDMDVQQGWIWMFNEVFSN